MMSALARAYRDHASIVVTLWSPHWAFAQYDLKYLDDTENDFGGSDDIHFMSRAGFGQDFPEVLGWLNAWAMSDGELGSLMLTIERAGNAEAGPASGWRKTGPSPTAGWRQKEPPVRDPRFVGGRPWRTHIGISAGCIWRSFHLNR